MFINKIFPTAVWHEDYNFDLDKLKKFCLDLEKEYPNVIKSNVGGWQSDFINLQEKNVLTDVLKKLNEDINLSIKHDLRLNKDLKIVASWVNINRSGNYNTPHIHAKISLSGCFYISIPDQESNLSFIRPKTLQDSYECDLYNQFTDITTHTCEYTPIPNRAIFFPAWLYHSVNQHWHEEPRISVAFNLI